MGVKYGSFTLTLMTLKCKFLGIADVERWNDLESLELDWDQRTRMVAELIPAGSRVTEFGAGRKRLQNYLHSTCKYYASDLVSRGEGTIIIDLNHRPLPNLSHLRTDVVVFAGVLEYIKDLPSLIRWLPAVASTCIASYECCHTPPQTLLRLRETFKRIGVGWVNTYSEPELEYLFSSAGFFCNQKLIWTTPDGDERIFVFQRREVLTDQNRLQ
jgi:methyltransferase family protein